MSLAVFDANAFFGKWPYWPVDSGSAADVVAMMDVLQIQRAAVCSTRSLFVHWEDGNLEVERAVREHPARLAPFACVGTTELSHRLLPPVSLAGYVARGFRGIRLYPQHHSYHPLYEPFIGPLLEEAEALGIPVLLPLRVIMNWGLPSLTMDTVSALVTRHPRVVWILSGINYLWELQMAISLMRRFPSVHLETSCMMGYASIAKTVQQCGAQQLLFGSGAPLQNAASGLSKVLHAEISDHEKEAVLGGNLCRLLRDD
jgi:predicted TIM-barrel fold metal-dependent hydrolase